ncbi:zinc-binding dehydrogenase [Prauserella cavernicola]|uniref:Zinc-binding dehydrogenase n=1 Tax=Prauserella cavernicola TaxID=2800127 RepID=A0A934QVH9_9PSEU|nr:zinc-binding dehydrogenase [Prauserella cavernicola]MBK1787205.1 zinc-binding dehydrogenase [Prauserella cavernicola]
MPAGPKVRHLLDDLRLDAAVDHRAPDFAEQLALAVPNGIDTIYDNVGAAVLPALLPHLNPDAQIVVGGVMSQITRTGAFDGPDRLPDLLRAAVYKKATIRGFNVMEFVDCYPDFLAELAPAVADGKAHYKAHIFDGLEAIPETFPDMFTSRVTGKMIAKISAAPGAD